MAPSDERNDEFAWVPRGRRRVLHAVGQESDLCLSDVHRRLRVALKVAHQH